VGVITGDTPAEFNTFVQGRGVQGATIVLDSPGGSTLGAMTLGGMIRRLRMTTAVGRTIELPARDGETPQARLSPDADCESMCALVLLAGIKRHMPAEARVRVHGIWLGGRSHDPMAASYSAEELAIMQRDLALLAQYTIEMGGSIELLATAARVPPWEPLRLLLPDELRRMGLVNADATRSAPIVGGELKGSSNLNEPGATQPKSYAAVRFAAAPIMDEAPRRTVNQLRRLFRT
jgi:hypothetical protein